MTAIMAQKCSKLGDNIFFQQSHALMRCIHIYINTHKNMLWRVRVCIIVVGRLLFFARECGKRESHAGTKRPLKAGLKTHSFVAAGVNIKILVGLLAESPFLGV